ncbi:MAG: YraN family protein [Gammaproteobacteria bacterium]|nr:YraN family protein [Gammaproteobacteria bacterium]
MGDWAEGQACLYLQAAGWHIITRNFHCRGGELDIIAKRDAFISFVEVKYRRSQAMGGALTSITQQKRKHLTYAAQTFLQHFPKYYSYSARFDLICVSGRPQGQVKLQWLTNIFSLTD